MLARLLAAAVMGLVKPWPCQLLPLPVEESAAQPPRSPAAIMKAAGHMLSMLPVALLLVVLLWRRQFT
jgi:hypothetical protein